jgi:diadenosine tetraphosphate (Ap4A) HIT family hydrolase
MTCPFCKIDKKRTKIVEIKKYVMVIFSNKRLVPGHLLIVPRRHILRPSELSDAERKEIFDTLIEYQDKIVPEIAAGCDIKQNYRPFLKQDDHKVDHIHYHLLPRNLFDELFERSDKFHTLIFKKLPNEELKMFMPLLKKKKKPLK